MNFLDIIQKKKENKEKGSRILSHFHFAFNSNIFERLFIYDYSRIE